MMRTLVPVLPRRMESYDISHTGGADQVASMVVFVDGRPLTSMFYGETTEKHAPKPKKTKKIKAETVNN